MSKTPIYLDPLDKPIRGAKAIGKAIGENERVAFNLLQGHQLPATKVGRHWTTTARRLIARFNEDVPPTKPAAPPPRVPTRRKRKLQRAAEARP
jgi:hypothetical protein